MIIVFSLMTNCQDRDGFVVVDLEQSDVTSSTKWNN